MKQFTVTILVDEDDLLQAYMQGHGVGEEDCPNLDDMILSELQWVAQSGIDIIGELQ